MKRSSIIGMLALVVLAGGCNNTYTVRTTIHADGSFEKIILCRGDSLGIDRLPLPFRFKEGWKIDRSRDTSASGGFLTTASKRFAGDEELQAELKQGSDSSKLAVTMHVEKRFRWFYTYYTYQEEIPAFGRFRQSLPFDSAFTQAEIERLRAGKDSLLNKRVDQYWTRNVVGELIDNLEAPVQRLNDPALAPARWKEKRNILAEHLISSDASKAEDVTRVLEETFKAPSVRRLQGAIDTSYTMLIAKVEAERVLDVSYRNEVVMPGMLLSSNAESVEGGMLVWQCQPQRFLDVAMTAESRVLNLWAVIATAVVSFALLAALVLPMVRVRRRAA